MTGIEFCGAEIYMFARTKRLTVAQGLRLNSDTSSGGCEDVDTQGCRGGRKHHHRFQMRGPQGDRVIDPRRGVF